MQQIAHSNEVPSEKRGTRTERVSTRYYASEPRRIRYRYNVRREVLNLSAVEQPIETIVSAMTYGLLKGARSFEATLKSDGSKPHHIKIDIAK
ncbi:hypothetical protein TELCIR_04927 [Teladorsagia circumcincta]|uniref:Uncharacterized protein n=1 Tax=Teladorsagia circumcincta TaxID=45464 RepID=A0A2G9USA7_TELCI|nr:hypothetical protein TELCIR_04927 [Teladorsagia circumcincta]